MDIIEVELIVLYLSIALTTNIDAKDKRLRIVFDNYTGVNYDKVKSVHSIYFNKPKTSPEFKFYKEGVIQKTK